MSEVPEAFTIFSLSREGEITIIGLEIGVELERSCCLGGSSSSKVGNLSRFTCELRPKIHLGSTALLSVLLVGCVDVTAHGLVKYPRFWQC